LRAFVALHLVQTVGPGSNPGGPTNFLQVSSIFLPESANRCYLRGEILIRIDFKSRTEGASAGAFSGHSPLKTSLSEQVSGLANGHKFSVVRLWITEIRSSKSRNNLETNIVE
jgi:hypothetical protein